MSQNLKWFLSLLLAGLAVGAVSLRTGTLKRGLAKAKAKLPRMPWLEEVKQPWWKTG